MAIPKDSQTAPKILHTLCKKMHKQSWALGSADAGGAGVRHGSLLALRDWLEAHGITPVAPDCRVAGLRGRVIEGDRKAVKQASKQPKVSPRQDRALRLPGGNCPSPKRRSGQKSDQKSSGHP